MNRFLTIILLFFFQTVWTQSDDVQIKVYGFEDGISHRIVLKILQDQQGYIWMATINGLNRFDGTKFIHYNNQSLDHYIPVSYITDLSLDTLNQIFLASEGQITILNTRTSTVDVIKTIEEGRLHGKKFDPGNLYVDSKNQLWSSSASLENDLSYLQKVEKDKLLDIYNLRDGEIDKPIIEWKQSLLVGGQEGLIIQYDLDGNVKKRHRLPSKANVADIHIDKNNELWVLMKNGELFWAEKNLREIKRYDFSTKLPPSASYNGLHVENDGNFWIVGANLLFYYDNKNRVLKNYVPQLEQLIKHEVNCRNIYKDRQGVIWVASDFGAIKLFQSNKLFTTYLSEGSEYCNNGECSIRGITGDEDGNVYFSYYNSIHKLNTKTNELSPLFLGKRFFNNPYGLLYHEEALWTGNGTRIDLETKAIDTIFQNLPTEEGVLAMKGDGIWMANGKSIIFHSLIDNSNIKLTNLSDSINSPITYLLPSRDGNSTWIGTQKRGVFQVDNEYQIIQHFDAKEENEPRLASERILGLYEDDSQNIWMATAIGLHQLHLPSETLKVFTSEEGLANNFINGLLSHGDTTIWVSTDNGLSQLDVRSEKIVNYSTEDGLSGNEFNRISAYQAMDGRMYFGGLHGVNAFYPENVFAEKKQQANVPVLFTGFTKFDGTIDSIVTEINNLKTDSALNFSHKDKFFSFEYALADYANPGNNMYSYLLEGFEHDWSEYTPANQARYYNIPPGDYVFRVRATAASGKAISQELSIPIHVKQAYYKSWWFMGMCGLFLLGFMYTFFRYRIYTIEKRRGELERVVDIRTQELQKEKQKSDELLLNILPSETAEELKQFGKAKAKKYESVTVFFSDFKDFSKIAERLSPEELVAEIDLCFRTFDEIMEMYGLEKIKTIGDAYMCAGGMNNSEKNEAVMVVRAALEIQSYMNALAYERKEKNEIFFEARIGIHTGSVVAGIVGIKKFAYDIWGDTVNIAARMEGNGEVGKVNISEATYQLIKEEFNCTYRGKMEVKNKGMVDMYFVDGKK